MTATAQKVLDEGLTLPEAVRSRVALALLESTRQFDDDEDEDDPGAEAAWDDEIAKRIEEIDSGKVVELTETELNAKLQARFPWLS